MQITVTLTDNFSDASAFAEFAAKIQAVFGEVRTAVIGTGGDKPATSAPVTDAPKVLQKRTSDYTVEVADVDPVNVEAVEAETVVRSDAEPMQQPPVSGDAKKRTRRTREQIAADEAAKAAVKAGSTGETAAPGSSTPVVAAEAGTQKAAAAAVSSRAPTIDEVREAFGDLVDVKGGEARFAGILSPYGVTAISKLKPECYAEVVAKIRTAIAELTGAPSKPAANLAAQF